MEKDLEEEGFICSCGYKGAFSKIKLRRINQIKYCLKCGGMVQIVMVGFDGYCPNCEEKLYTIDTRSEKIKWENH